MPFQSLSQMRWMFANKPKMAKKWAKETRNIKGLPEKKQLGGLWDTNKKGFVDSTLQANKQLEFVDRLYNGTESIQVPGQKNRSTHLMAYDPASMRVFPEVVKKNGKLTYLGHGDAPYDYADSTGEYIQFKTPEQAEWFANSPDHSTGYKMGTNVLNDIIHGHPFNKKQEGGKVLPAKKQLVFKEPPKTFDEVAEDVYGNQAPNYIPSAGVEWLKKGLAVSSIATTRLPKLSYLSDVAGATGDLYTGARHLMAGDYSEAAKDGAEAAIGYIPMPKATLYKLLDKAPSMMSKTGKFIKGLKNTVDGANILGFQKGGYSTEGYKQDSPDRNNAYNIIPSSNITMQDVNHPVIGVDNLGFQKLMMPGEEHQFQGDQVLEIPLKEMKSGGINPAHKGWCTPMTKSTCTGKRKQFALNMKKMARNSKQLGGGAWSTDENYQFPVNPMQHILPKSNIAPMAGPQISNTQDFQVKPLTQKEKAVDPLGGQNLSYLPEFANSIAQAIASRVDNNRELQYQRDNLANPLNYIPNTNNTNKYVNYGTPSYQEGGTVDDSQDSYENLQDEDFLFDDNASSSQVEDSTEGDNPTVAETPTPEVEDESQQVQIDESSPTLEIDEDGVPYSSTDVGQNFNRVFQPKSPAGLDEEIASVESGGDYRAENPHSSAVGKYQFLWSKWGDEIRGVTGIGSKEEFKNNPQAQESFYSYYKQQHLLPAAQRLRAINSRGLSDAQLAKLVHFKGEGGARKYLTQGIDDTRANNISIPKYIGS